MVELPQGGCDVCKLEARADRRDDALIAIACRSVEPEFLNRCTVCGSFWLQTMRFEAWLARKDAVELFGEIFDAVDWPQRLIEIVALWDLHRGHNQQIYVAEPWSPDSPALVVFGYPDDAAPIVVRDDRAFAHLLDGARAYEIVLGSLGLRNDIARPHRSDMSTRPWQARLFAELLICHVQNRTGAARV